MRLFVRTSFGTNLVVVVTAGQLRPETTIATVYALTESFHEQHFPEHGGVIVRTLSLLRGRRERPGNYFQLSRNLRVLDTLDGDDHCFAALERRQVPDAGSSQSTGSLVQLDERLTALEEQQDGQRESHEQEVHRTAQSTKPAATSVATPAPGTKFASSSEEDASSSDSEESPSEEDSSGSDISNAETPTGSKPSRRAGSDPGSKGTGDTSELANARRSSQKDEQLESKHRSPAPGQDQEEGGREANEGMTDSEDEAGPENNNPALAQLMARPDGLQIMLRARKLELMRRDNSEAEPNDGCDPDHEAPADSQATHTVMQQGPLQPAEAGLVGTQASQAFPSTPPMPALPQAAPSAPASTPPQKQEPPKPKQAKPAKTVNILEEAADLEKADAVKRAADKAAAAALPHPDELRSLLDFKRMSKVAIKLVINMQRAADNEPRVDGNIFVKTPRPSWWPLDDWSGTTMVKNKKSSEAAYCASYKRWQQLTEAAEQSGRL
ncbi:hypothetical protein WJX84_010761 [Apatococcus fuscideae]|uniref:Uncharacterized protein n=1 Tax=Apatococcus fuscideae TaxID=2026836 RepID=A0AAW1TEK4_9CHLO